MHKLHSPPSRELLRHALRVLHALVLAPRAAVEPAAELLLAPLALLGNRIQVHKPRLLDGLRALDVPPLDPLPQIILVLHVRGIIPIPTVQFLIFNIEDGVRYLTDEVPIM